ncbi:predicted protein [Naegleria gruberi]|uniref:Predicted protein n=1 Tax=Naegleria gruberi TaxID=5762 RepID=D2V9P2_NAEGR|nr:uncharacterized protein NAEGRDRAFT_65508 [Naegleria gruberi]EFC46619.1 predicted protein [Naegleria gruberi]|eukprot:XP_002679363.1 predicted protein [Naegleria gruberi strain NEG-M]
MIEEDSSPLVDSKDKDEDYVQESSDGSSDEDISNMIDEDYEEPTPIKTCTITTTSSTGRRKKRTNSSRTPIASHSTLTSNTSNTANTTNATTGDAVDDIDIANGPTQTLCCLKGCDHAISNRLRFSLRTCKDSDFKVDYMNKGFNWVCNYHYFHDLYLYKKSQKNSNNNSSTTSTTKRKRSKSNATTTTTTTKQEDPAVVIPTISVTTPQQQSTNSFEATITNMIPSLLHSNLLLSSQPVPVATSTTTTKRKRSSSNVNTAKKSKTIVDSVVLNTSMNFQTTSTPSSLISSSKMTFGNTTSGVATKKKNLKVSTQELTLTNSNYAQPSPVNTDDVMALINFSMGISM